SGVSGVSGASFSGVSGFTSSFSFTTVLVLVAINYLLTSPAKGNSHTDFRVPLPYGKSPRPHLDPPLTRTTKLPLLRQAIQACPFHMPISHADFTWQHGQCPNPGTAPAQAFLTCIPSLAEPS